MINFYNRLKVLENTSGIYKNNFQWLTEVKTRINGHDEDLDMLDKEFYLTMRNKIFYKQP